EVHPVPRPQPKHPGDRPPGLHLRPPPNLFALSLTVPPAGGGPIGDGLESPFPCPAGSPRGKNRATRRSLTGPDPRPGSRVGPWLRRTGRRHVPRLCSPHEGVLNRSLSDPSPRASFPWETLPGAFNPQTI
ncbi:hypothetical protein CRENBAI_014378, partial [Crenichthys baileyi]